MSILKIDQVYFDLMKIHNICQRQIGDLVKSNEDFFTKAYVGDTKGWTEHQVKVLYGLVADDVNTNGVKVYKQDGGWTSLRDATNEEIDAHGAAIRATLHIYRHILNEPYRTAR